MKTIFPQSVQPHTLPVSTAWEVFLADEGISESACPSFLRHPTKEGYTIRCWVLANYKTRYVPESVIQALELSHQHNHAS
jgi:hypothetical protein